MEKNGNERTKKKEREMLGPVFNRRVIMLIYVIMRNNNMCEQRVVIHSLPIAHCPCTGPWSRADW